MNTNWPELPPEAAAQIDAALAQGNKIEAIKLYRFATNVGLKEAKDAIERVAPKIPVTATPRPRTNLLTIVLVLFILAGVVIAILVATHKR